MMFRAQLATFTSALILAGSSFASQEVCPELNAIKATGISMAMEITGLYAAYQINNFDTDVTWGFVLAPLESNSVEEAIQKGNQILNTMSSPGVVIDVGVCLYETGVPEVYALAVQDDSISPLKLKHYIHK